MFRKSRNGIILFLILCFLCTSSCGTQEVQPMFYTAENTQQIKSDQIRTVVVDQQTGIIWLGYAGEVGVGSFDGKNVRFNFKSSHVNTILPYGNNVYVGTDSKTQPKGGVLQYNTVTDKVTDLYSSDNLPDYRVYTLVQHDNAIYAGTYTGISKYQDKKWTKEFCVFCPNGKNISNNEVDTLLFATNGDVWVGHIDQGISWFSKKEKKWRHLGSEVLSNKVGGVTPTLEGDNVRAIVEGPGNSIWIASDGGGVMRYQNGVPKSYNQGLPTNAQKAQDLKFDKKGRVWVGTSYGLYYWDNGWKEYKTEVPHLPVFSIDFGSCSKKCAITGDFVVAGTQGKGLMVGPLP